MDSNPQPLFRPGHCSSPGPYLEVYSNVILNNTKHDTNLLNKWLFFYMLGQSSVGDGK